MVGFLVFGKIVYIYHTIMYCRRLMIIIYVMQWKQNKTWNNFLVDFHLVSDLYVNDQQNINNLKWIPIWMSDANFTISIFVWILTEDLFEYYSVNFIFSPWLWQIFHMMYDTNIMLIILRWSERDHQQEIYVWNRLHAVSASIWREPPYRIGDCKEALNESHMA